MPFGDSNSFWDHGPCARCGGYGAEYVVARRGGGWPWQRGWVDRHGAPVAVTNATEDR